MKESFDAIHPTTKDLFRNSHVRAAIACVVNIFTVTFLVLASTRDKEQTDFSIFRLVTAEDNCTTR